MIAERPAFWDQRPLEIAYLLNPAFCGEILRQCIRSYASEARAGLPYTLAFLVLPIVLHSDSRSAISPRQRQPLHGWLQEHQELRIGFADRTQQLVSITKEAIIFLLQVEAATINERAELNVTSNKRRTISEQNQGEIADCYRKAEIIGRWFARAGSPATIYAMWGVRP